MLFDRYNTANLKRALKDPSLVVNEFFYRPGGYLFETLRKYHFWNKYGRGIDVMQQDWDNMILLDACRYDMFKEHNTIDGKLDFVISRASKTPEFVEKNFAERDLHDTVYVTENPHAEDVDDDVFYTIVKMYDAGLESRAGVDQRRIREAAIDAIDEFPDKRLLVHFMPPHFPALGSRADEVRARLRDEHGVVFEQIQRLRGEHHDSSSGSTLSNLKDAVKEGYISIDDLEEIYCENLRLVLSEVKELLEHLEGKTVITSDHGELLGRNKIFRPVPQRFGHHKYVYVPELRVVPWLVVESGTRREIVPEDPIGSARVPDDIKEERLAALGYMN